MQSCRRGEDMDRLRWRREAEAGFDESEQEANPQDPNGFYLRKLEIVASLLAEVNTDLGDPTQQVAFRGRDLLECMDICVCRLKDIHASHKVDEQWLSLWDSFAAAIVAVERRADNSSTTAQVVKIIFVSSAVLARVYEAVSPCGPTGLEKGFVIFARALPFPIETEMPLAEQMQRVSQNLRWLHEQMRRRWD